jgi:transglutaminase-like putative cysteine protease
MIYDIRLTIAYHYDSPATGGRHLVRVLPADIPGVQRLIAGHVDIRPTPAERTDRVDFFGNSATDFAFSQPHDDIVLHVQARVDRGAGGASDIAGTALASLAAEVGAVRSLSPASPAHFTAPSVRVQPDVAITRYAQGLVHPAMTATAAVAAIGAALHRDMTFDPKATEVDTPPSEAFAARTGVCQDFSHIMIACLRAIGVPAGYVSGFLRTLPPPGQPRLEGADAMHAWVRAWCGAAVGWVEFDPTNAAFAGQDHIVVAYGRDYFDVAPVKGVLRVAGGQTSTQSVDVIPITDRA